MVKKPGFADKSKSVIVEQNKTSEIEISLVNYRKDLLPTRFAKGTMFILFSSGLIGGISSQLIANQRFKDYK